MCWCATDCLSCPKSRDRRLRKLNEQWATPPFRSEESLHSQHNGTGVGLTSQPAFFFRLFTSLMSVASLSLQCASSRLHDYTGKQLQGAVVSLNSTSLNPIPCHLRANIYQYLSHFEAGVHLTLLVVPTGSWTEQRPNLGLGCPRSPVFVACVESEHPSDDLLSRHACCARAVEERRE